MRIALVLGAAALGAIAACEDPLAPFLGITATSGAPQPGSVAAHTHRVTVPPGDIENPPSQGVQLNTTTSAIPSDHQHTVDLTAAQLMDLQQDMAGVDVPTRTSGEPDFPHHHNFILER